MAGFPQLRQVGIAYAVDDPGRPLAWVRLFERVDGSGWELWLNWPAEAGRRVFEHPDGESARAAAGRVYGDTLSLRELADVYGLDPQVLRWRIREPDAY
ncbi:hypothetical protein ACFWC6_33385 [Micromonospora chalcea]